MCIIQARSQDFEKEGNKLEYYQSNSHEGADIFKISLKLCKFRAFYQSKGCEFLNILQMYSFFGSQKKGDIPHVPLATRLVS